MGIFRKHICPDCFPPRYKRKPGSCPKCGARLKPGPYCVEWSDASGRRCTETVDGGVRAAEQLWAKRKGRAGEETQPAKIRFETLAEDYKETVSTKHADGGTRDGYAIRNLCEHFGPMICPRIQRRDVEAYLRPRKRLVGCGKKKDGEILQKEITVSLGTLAREMRLFRTIWKYGQQHYHLGTDPSAGVPIKEPKPPIKAPPTFEDEERAWAALPETSRPFYQFLAYTGARTREATQLLKADVDLENRIAWVRHKTRAGDIEREPLHLDDEALKIIKAEIEKADQLAKDNPEAKKEYVFLNPQTGNPWASPKTVFRRAMKRIGLADKIKSPHALRHLFVSRLVEGGVHPIVAMELSRHKDPRTFKRYAHNAPNHLQEALKKGRKRE